MRTVGTVVRGVRAPVIREGDNLAQIVVDSLLSCAREEKFQFRDRDVVAVTEAVVARAQGNYAPVGAIAKDIVAKFGHDAVIGLTFPITSRNRFAVCLKGIAMGAKKLYFQMSYPSDEVGNSLFDPELLDRKGIDPYTDVLDEQKYRELFGYETHPFTGMDYVAYFGQLIRDCGCEVEFIFSNNIRTILDYTKNVLACDIHTRARSKRLLQAAGAERVYCLSDILTAPVDGSGYNESYGLLGSNKATEDSVKLFPRNCQPFVDEVQRRLGEATGKSVEVMVYGDGAFKDPVGKIWELADPVVSPAYTKGLAGTPNEIKLKYLADNQFAHLKGAELDAAIRAYIQQKDGDLKGDMSSQGTTPRQLTDLIGSLCDLTSGSGDKGTPIVFIQGYFDSFAV